MSPPVLVLTDLGRLRGARRRTCGPRRAKIFSFRRIPYAAPPLGNLRLAPPRPPQPWQGTLDCAGGECTPCLQVTVLSPESRFLVGGEDCLYLNVFTPRLPGAARDVRLPVVVFLHGGAFCVGSNDSRLYGPDRLLDSGQVVLVVPNYRLGPLGFLCFEDERAPGNLGMRDQVLALRWVRDHVGSFGGDPDDVTIMGESAGGMAALLHLVSPMTKGLFHKVIAMSASGSTPFLHNARAPSVYARAFAKEVLAKSAKKDLLKAATEKEDEVGKALRRLRAIPARSIVERTTVFKDWDLTNPMPWKPVVDGSFCSDPFLPVPFEEAVRAGRFNRGIPILAGTVTEEGLVLSAPFHRGSRRWANLFRHWDAYAPQVFLNREVDLPSQENREAMSRIREHFFGCSGDEVPPRDEKNLRRLEQIFSSAIFQAPLERDVRMLRENGARHVHRYSFGYQGSMTLVDIFRLSMPKMILNFTGRFVGAKLYQKRLGVCHGDELFYLFPFSMTGFPNPIKTDNDRNVASNFQKIVLNFVKNGTPGNVVNGGGGDATSDITATIDRSGKLSCCKKSTLKEEEERVEFWLEATSGLRTGMLAGDELSSKPIATIHEVTVEKRGLVTDPKQLFS